MPAFAPVILNVCMMVGAIWVAPLLAKPILAVGYAVAVAGLRRTTRTEVPASVMDEIEDAVALMARALRQAVEYDVRVTGVPSTKGTL